MIYLLLITHLYFTLKLNFPQRHTFKGIKYSFSPSDKHSGIGTYEAFASALGTTIGPGNITGVALTVSLGGAGSVFWMWLCGVLAMSTKYVESLLAIKFTERKNGTVMGGTMTVLSALGNRRLAMFWSLCCAAAGLLMGSAVPANSLSEVLPLPKLVTAVCLCALVTVTVCFGVRAIARVSALVVPVMSVLFLGFCMIVIFKNITLLPSTLSTIIKDAFNVRCAVSGGLAAVIKQGITRGMYSNESGLGSGGVLAAESGDTNIKMSALSAMTTVFWDTVVMCAVTGVMFVITGGGYGMDMQAIMSNAFGALPRGHLFFAVSMSLFVFACIIGWYYIAKRALDFCFRSSPWYDVLFVAAVFLGSVTNAYSVWHLADIVNVLMLLPSLYSMFKMFKNKLYIVDI